MSDSLEVASALPPIQEESWTIHPSIDPDLTKDKSRKARSENPGWRYSGWPNVANKNTVQCILCEHISKGGIKRLKEHLIGGFSNVAKCAKTTNAIREEMINWNNRGLKRNPEGTIQPSDAGSNAIDVDDNDDVPKSAKRKASVIASGSGQRKDSLGKKVEPLDVLCQENLVQFIADRRTTKGKKQTVIEDHFKKQERDMVDDLCATFIYQCGYEEDGLTWAEVDEAMGASELYDRPRRITTTQPLLERGSGNGRGRRNQSTSVLTYSRKSKEVVVEEDCENEHEEEGFKFQDDYDNLMSHDSD